MKSINAYSASKYPKRILLSAQGYLIIFVYLLTFLPGLSSFGQDSPAYEEIQLFLDVPNLGGRDMDVLIMEDEVYLPITDFFDFLMIRNIPSPDLDTITGFFINQEATYLIDRDKSQIRYGDELFELKPGDLIRTETNLYLRGYYFGHIFGLDCEFSFRTMSVRVNTRLELPAIREMRLQTLRKNMNRLVGEEEADTIIGRSYPWFHFGMADWSANFTEQINGQVDSRLSLGLGSIIAGGEATVALNYNSYTPITEKQQYYLWRYVNNDNSALRQVMAGKFSTGATSSIYDPVVGAKITNTPTQFRRSFGTYTLSERTEPGWIVELYVNNILVDYATADASGFFTFEVPLVYGNTYVRLKFYGPWGEERAREQNITVPFNFIPKKTLEYSVSAGMVEDGRQSLFSRTSVFYGLSRSITIGTGVEYLSSVSSGQVMPFVNGSFRLASNLLLSGEFSPAVRSNATLTYRLPSNLQFDLNYIYYTKDQKAINNNFREERKFSMSMPIRITNFSLYNRLSINQLVLPTTNYTTSEWLISGALFGVSTNITSYAVFIGNTAPYFYSDFSMSFRIPKNITLQPRAQYSYSNKNFLSAKLLAEMRVLKKGYLTASYEQNFRSNMHLVEFGFRYDFKFAQTSISTRQSSKSSMFIQYARGSIINDSKTNYVYTDNRSNVGKGGISIIPFLDKNANGTREPGEPKVYGLNLRANGGRIEKREMDTTIRIFGLEPYTDCFIEFDQSSFDNIAWRLKFRTMNIAVDPNLIKLVEIPINVVGEAAGMVRMDQKGVLSGLARIIVNFYDKDQKKIGRTLTEDDGYFSYFGLNPGTYDARIDSAQLRKLGFISTPDSVNFNIAANLDGDYVDGLDFIVKLDTLKVLKNIDMIVHEEIEQEMDETMDSYVIQIGAFKNEAEADSLRNQLSALLGKEVSLFPEDGLYKIRVTGFATRNEVEETFPVLLSKGIKEIKLITNIGVLDSALTTNIPGIVTDPFRPFAEGDTSVAIVNEMIEKDMTSITDSYAIEVGAIENETEAVALQDQLTKLMGKDVSLIHEDNLYKVRVTGFATSNEVKKSFPVLKSQGISEIGLIFYKGMLNTDPTTNIQSIGIVTDPFRPFAEGDTSVAIVNEMIEKDMTSITDSYAIEVGAIENRTEADALREKLSKLLGKDVSLILENNLYKVRVTGFASSNEVKESFPVLKSQGISEIGLIFFKGLLNSALTTNIQGIGIVTDPFRPFTQGDNTVAIVNEMIEKDMTSITDSYAIEVGAIENETEAVALQDQLTKLMGKDVSLIHEDNLYKVRVTGFATSNEVKKSFPVLKSQGISEIGLIFYKGMLNTDPTTNIQSIGIVTDPFRPFAEGDTSVTIANEMIEKDMTSITDSYAIEVGAIENRTEADALREKLSKLLGKDVSLILENNLYKVRVTGFASSNKVKESFPVLKSQGISEIGLIFFKGMLNSDLTTNIQGIKTGPVKTYSEKDTTVVIVHEITEEDTTSSMDSYVIQLGAFKQKENANKLKEKLTDVLDKEVIITVKDEYYKVRVIGFETSYEVKNFIPELVRNGFKEIWAVNLKGTQKPSSKMKPDKEVIDSYTKKGTSYLIIDESNVESMTTGKDSYAIQVGAFNLKINADVFRIKLATILDKEVEIFVEDELYQVRIPGFRTRDEVDAYIPVLQKIGVSETRIVNLKENQKHWISTSRIDTIAEGLEKFTKKDTSYLIKKETLKEVKKSTPDSSVISRKKIIPEKKKEELPVIPTEEKVTKKTEVKEKPADVAIVEEPKKETVVSHASVERKKTFEERLLEAEYRSGLYESRWPGVEFTIQIAASKSISDPEVIKRKFDISSDVEVVKGGEWYRFTVGHYIKYWKAREYRNILISRNGIDDAFIIAYKEGKKIMFTDLLAMVETTPDSNTGTTVRPAVSRAFSVQILATKDGNVSESTIREKYDVDEDIFKEYNPSDGLYRYSIGDFSSYIEAAKVRNRIRASGIRDAFVVGFKDGKRVADPKSIL